MTTTIHCAIGDIHGELERLKDLHQQVRRHARDFFPQADIRFVHLGDLVDRGPESCGVVEYLMAFETAVSPKPVTLRGNHEQMMLNAYDGDGAGVDRRIWCSNGGDTTLESYARRPADVLDRHLDWLAQCPTIYRAPEAGLVFVHAGIDPDRFPACGDQVRLWTRRREFMDTRCWTAPDLRSVRVVHGHTPTRDSRPDASGDGRRLNIDTGAVYGGRLTAVILRPGEPDLFFHA
ncbi:MAG: serine/threonine protein phosphatase [Acidobacteria bacterium]|nr:serine/threonine protein phosphatase [Acidobacteriota bacterium]